MGTKETEKEIDQISKETDVKVESLQSSVINSINVDDFKEKDSIIINNKMTNKIVKNLEEENENIDINEAEKEIQNVEIPLSYYLKFSKLQNVKITGYSNVKSYLNDNIVKEIIKDKELFSKFKKQLKLNELTTSLIEYKFNEEKIDLGYAGPIVRKKLYKTFTLASCLAILYVANKPAPGKKNSKTVSDIDKWVKKGIKNIKKKIMKDTQDDDKRKKLSEKYKGKTLILLCDNEYDKYSNVYLCLAALDKANMKSELSDILECGYKIFHDGEKKTINKSDIKVDINETESAKINAEHLCTEVNKSVNNR